MKITPNQRFRHAGTTYEKNAEYEVPEAEGGYFVGVGWATSPDYKPAPPASAAKVHELQPDSGAHKSKAKEA